MGSVAETIDEAEVVQELGLVTHLEAGELTVQTSRGRYVARRAFSCLVEPLPDDRVLVATSAAGDSFVLAVLERMGPEPRAIAVDGDLRVRVREGRLAFAADEGLDIGTSKDLRVVSASMDVKTRDGRFFSEKLDLLSRFVSMDVERVKSVVGTLDLIADRVSQKLKNSYRQVEEMDVTRAGQLDMRAKENVHVRGRNTLLSAELLAKVDAEQIHLG